MTVVATAVFYPLPGRKEELATAMQAGIEAVHGEKGCELYAIHDAEDGTITMIEKWTTAEDLAAHAGGAAEAILRGDVEDLLEKQQYVTERGNELHVLLLLEQVLDIASQDPASAAPPAWAARSSAVVHFSIMVMVPSSASWMA